MLENLKMVTGDLYPLVITFMVLFVMIFLVSIYAAIRVDKLWAFTQRQRDIEQLRKEVKADLKNS
jgi:hypothetical protein